MKERVLKWYDITNQDVDKRLINDYDINILANTINFLINRDFTKIYKLGKYLYNVASICNKLSIPISWSLANGLKKL